MGLYDQTARFAIKQNPQEFLRWLLPRLDPDLSFSRWLDTQTIPFPGEPDRRCDTVAELVHSSGLAPPWALIAEVQTRPDYDLPDRLLEYLARARRELRHGPQDRDRYLVAGALLSLTGPRQPEVVEMLLPGMPEVGLHFGIRVVALETESAAATLEAIAQDQVGRSLLPWVALMAGAELPATIARWKEVAEQGSDRRLRGYYRSVAWIFAELAGHLVPWRQALEGWDVEESQLVQEWIEQGRLIGLELSIEQGRVETRRDAILRMLLHFFGKPVPPAVEGALHSQADFAVLTRWFDLALEAASLDEFCAGIGIATCP